MHLLIILIFVVPLVFRLINAITNPDRLKAWEGRNARRLLEQRFGTFRSNKKISTIGKKLAEAADLKAQFYLIDQPLINAGALPNGDIVIWKGLFQRVSHDPNQLAGIIAHELGHLKHEHYLRQIYWTILLQFVLGFIARPLMGPASRRIAIWMMDRGFSRFRERQADDAAILIMRQAGFDPKALIAIFESLDDLPNPMGFLGTHPKPLQRAARIRKALQLPEDKPPSKTIESNYTSSNVIIFPRRSDNR